MYLGLTFVCYSTTVEVKILNVVSGDSYYCSMGSGRSSEPKQQCWLESPLKTNLNSLWHWTFIYPTDTDSIAPGCLTQPCSIFHIFTMDKNLVILKYVKMCLYACVSVHTVRMWYMFKSVTEQLCLERSLRRLLLCSMIEWSFLISLPSSSASVYPLSQSHLLPHPYPLQMTFFICCPPLSVWVLVRQ